METIELDVNGGEQLKTKKCQHCDKTFSTNRLLKKHEQGVHGVKNKQCLQCDKAFTSNDRLSQHVLLVHGVKNKVCKDCGKAFRSSNGLKQHERGVHGVDTHAVRYKCEFIDCGFGSNTLGKLHKHRSTHFKKDLICQICQYTSPSSEQLMGHIEKHHPLEKWICDECGEVLSCASLLKIHKTTHTARVVGKYQCLECPQRFLSVRELRYHKSFKHLTEEYIHVCKVCQFDFIVDCDKNLGSSTEHTKLCVFMCHHCSDSKAKQD